MRPPAEPDPDRLPRIAEGAAFVPAEDLEGAPHVVVDGARLPGTALSLSHWPRAGTPPGLAADTSAEIVDRYLRAGAAGPEVAAVTNNHYDEDGLFGIWMLLERPAESAPERRLAIAAAEAGDFGTWTDPWAARAAIAAMAMAERATTPFPEVGRALARASGRDPAGALYHAILPRVGGLLADPGRYRMLWEPEWARVEADVALIDACEATIEDRPDADLAIVRAPRPLHDMAVHPRTGHMRILTALPDGTLVLRHRYETWVDYVSRPLPARVDLAPLLPALQALEREPGVWRFDGVEPIRPRLFLSDPRGRAVPSSLGADRLADLLAGVPPAEGAVSSAAESSEEPR
ncbi:MAG TPA: DUF6687 family protein [Miltoncostaeaceae bacterium]|nr:DUF6687 family protein [Miltoncostaeaceae bacterium]